LQTDERNESLWPSVWAGTPGESRRSLLSWMSVGGRTKATIARIILKPLQTGAIATIGVGPPSSSWRNSASPNSSFTMQAHSRPTVWPQAWVQRWVLT